VPRVVLDPGVLVSALITPTGTPARILAEARSGRFQLIVSPLLLDELREVLRRDKFRPYVALDVVDDFLALLRHDALLAEDPTDLPRMRSWSPVTIISSTSPTPPRSSRRPNSSRTEPTCPLSNSAADPPAARKRPTKSPTQTPLRTAPSPTGSQPQPHARTRARRCEAERPSEIPGWN